MGRITAAVPSDVRSDEAASRRPDKVPTAVLPHGLGYPDSLLINGLIGATIAAPRVRTGKEMNMTSQAQLPDPVLRLLDGNGLADKVGETFLLLASESTMWPRVAMLSAGEVFAPSPAEIRLALYPDSGTTQALKASGKGLLHVVVAPAAYRIRIEITAVGPVAGPDGDGSSLAHLTGSVVAVDVDQVGYATITSGITYALPQQGDVVRRWEQQVERLRSLPADHRSPDDG